MQLLALDIGTGTQDILFYDSEKSVENCFKLVLPSPTAIVASHIREARGQRKDVFLVGETMGGGPCVRAVREHLDSGLRVFAEEQAALTINDDLEKVKEMGVEIVEEVERDVLRVKTGDVDLRALGEALAVFRVKLPERVAVAVQDHGFSPGVSNRVTRFRYIRETLERDNRLDSFFYPGQIPGCFNRMEAVRRLVPGALVADTGMAAVRGALLDPRARLPAVVLNLGNGHTLGAVVVEDGGILGVFEHHTSLLSAVHVDSLVKSLCNGDLTFQEVFNEGGHGAFIHQAVGFENIEAILVTGPRRDLMEGSCLDLVFAAPFGDMMLTGCFGLVDFARGMWEG